MAFKNLKPYVDKHLGPVHRDSPHASGRFGIGGKQGARLDKQGADVRKLTAEAVGFGHASFYPPSKRESRSRPFVQHPTATPDPRSPVCDT